LKIPAAPRRKKLEKPEKAGKGGKKDLKTSKHVELKIRSS
jgi:hypothetical protein